ncbi:MAG TPA: hypothetical protein VLU95_09145 [Candidatus Acidoferrum sp.]|nr:hypothetical protein [Candidatus Acidoferrum sp.]
MAGVANAGVASKLSIESNGIKTSKAFLFIQYSPFNLNEEKTEPKAGFFVTTTFLTHIFIDFQKDTLTIPKRMVFSDDILTPI